MGRTGSSIGPARSPLRDHWRVLLLAAVLVVYLVLTLGIIFRSPILTLDTHLAHMHFRHRYPQWRPVIFYYVMLGQRGPATLLFLPYFLWTAWRRRSTTPIVMLVTALVLLNLSVGVVKYAVGRLGPRANEATHGAIAGAHQIFAGGDIYPSGHVSNTVVLYGLIAMLVTQRRRIVAWAAVLLSVTVGLGTVYLDTHWFSDVIGGWLAGLLVLIALPWALPAPQRWADAIELRIRARLRHRRARRAALQPTTTRPSSATAARDTASLATIDATGDQRARLG